MTKKVLFILYVALFVFFALTFVLVLIASFGADEVLKGTVMGILLAALAIMTLVGVIVFVPKKISSSVGFYLLHLGLVLFLLGQFIYATFGYKVNVSIRENDYNTYNRVKTTEGELIDLGFELGMGRFTEELYEDGSPKHYEAMVKLDGRQYSLTVNHPIYYGGYKIYLMSCYEGVTGSGQPATYVSLLLKHDRAEFLSTGGLIMLIVGGFCTAFAGPIEKKLKSLGAKQERREKA